MLHTFPSSFMRRKEGNELGSENNRRSFVIWFGCGRNQMPAERDMRGNSRAYCDDTLFLLRLSSRVNSSNRHASLPWSAWLL